MHMNKAYQKKKDFWFIQIGGNLLMTTAQSTARLPIKDCQFPYNQKLLWITFKLFRDLTIITRIFIIFVLK